MSQSLTPGWRRPGIAAASLSTGRGNTCPKRPVGLKRTRIPDDTLVGREVSAVSGLGRGVAEPEPDQHPAGWRDRPVNEPTVPLRRQPRAENDADAPVDAANLVSLHESIATLLASRGQYRQAYQHLRSALDLMSELTAPPPIPEQL